MSEVEVRKEAHVVAAVPVPQMLQELGVRIGRDESTGLAVVMVPPEVREKMNVINPVSSFAQSNPNWTPSISVVKLDKASHTYNISGKNGLNKQALETLAQAGGIIRTDTRRLRADELGPGERWGYEATVTIRRGDGQPHSTSRSRIFNEEAERGDIEESVRTSTKYTTDDAKDKEIAKRWRTELQMGPAKTESKAINRAIRAALQIPTSLTDADLKKPFLVIGYSFTPDYDDADVKRILVAAGLNAQHEIYGQPARAELETGSPVAERGEEGTETVVDAEHDGDGNDDAVPAEDQQADEAAEEAPTGKAASSVPGDDDPEPGPAPKPKPEAKVAESGEQSSFPVPEAVMVELESVVIQFEGSQWNGATLKDVGAHENGPDWLKWALRQSDDKLPGDLRAQVHAYVKARKPEMWAEFAGEES